MLWLAYVLLFLYGLAHTPILVDILRQLFPHWNIQRLTSSASSSILILLLLFFFLFGLGMHLFVFVPLMPQVTLRPVKLVFHCLFAYWVWINAVTNYMYIIFSRPGIFRPAHSDTTTTRATTLCSVKQSEAQGCETTQAGGNSDVLPVNQEQDSSKYHCKTCQASIPYRDHHCPFTGNCIGLSNYSYFYLWLFYSTLGLGYSVTVFFVYFGECFFLAWKDHVQSDEMRRVCANLEPYGETVLPAIGALVTATLVLLFHTFLLLADVTTYDLLKHWKTIRIDLTKFRRKNSRYRVLLLNQRTHLLWFLLPAKNKS